MQADCPARKGVNIVNSDEFKPGCLSALFQQVRRNSPAAVYHSLQEFSRRLVGNNSGAAGDPVAHPCYMRPRQIGDNHCHSVVAREELCNRLSVFSRSLFALCSIKQNNLVAGFGYGFGVAWIRKQIRLGTNLHGLWIQWSQEERQRVWGLGWCFRQRKRWTSLLSNQFRIAQSHRNLCLPICQPEARAWLHYASAQNPVRI